MSIKRIIREELEGWEWINDVPDLVDLSFIDIKKHPTIYYFPYIDGSEFDNYVRPSIEHQFPNKEIVIDYEAMDHTEISDKGRIISAFVHHYGQVEEDDFLGEMFGYNYDNIIRFGGGIDGRELFNIPNANIKERIDEWGREWNEEY